MNKADLIESVSDKSGLTKTDAERAISAAIESLSSALAAGESVQIVGFGTFDVRARAAREGRNPATGEKIQIKASNSVGFKAGKALKDSVN